MISLLFSKGKIMKVKSGSSAVFNNMETIYGWGQLFLMYTTSIQYTCVSLESQISTIFVLLNSLMLDCYACIRDCSLYCVVPKLRAKLMLNRIQYKVKQGACAIITALMKWLENNFQLSRVVGKLTYLCYIKIQNHIFNSINSLQ